MMQKGLHTGTEGKGQPTCWYCGRTLGAGFYYSCHVCDATYCYVHMPTRCSHKKAPVPQFGVVTLRKT